MFGKKPSKRKSRQENPLLPIQDYTLVLGTADGRPVQLQGKAARAHLRIIGVSGSGKSKLDCSIIIQAMIQGTAVLGLDPANDLCDDALMNLWDTGFYADERAFARCIYLDFGRPDLFVPFNFLAQPRPPHSIASSALEALHRTYPDIATGAPLIDSFVQYGCVCLIANQLPITMLPAFLQDADFRQALLQHVPDPQVHAYVRHFEEAGRRGGTQIESTLRRINLLTFNPELRYSLGSLRNLLSMREAMDRGTSFLINLGGLPAQSQRLLAALIAISVEEAALSREDLPEEQRTPYTFVGDEYSMYSANSAEAMERILALTRKYGLQLVVCSQSLSQLTSKTEGALQNAMQLVFRVGYQDAVELAPRLFTPDPYRLKEHPQMRTTYMSVSEQRTEFVRELTSLPPRVAYTRLGDQTIKFRSLAIPTPRCTREQLDALKNEYARRYLMSRSDIERELATRGPTIQSAHQPTQAQYRRGGVVVDADPPTPQHPRSAPPLPSPTQSPPHGSGSARRARRQIPLERDEQT